MDFFSVITLESLGTRVTVSAIITADCDTTRQDIHYQMRDIAVTRCGYVFEDATVLFFSAEPNTLTIS